MYFCGVKFFYKRERKNEKERKKILEEQNIFNESLISSLICSNVEPVSLNR